jgi:hypothetical protein
MDEKQQTSNQEVTNATILLEIKHLGEKVDSYHAQETKTHDDHEKRLRSLEESSAVFKYFMGAWNGLNSIGLILSAVFGIK